MGTQKFEATPTLENGQVTWQLCYTNPPQPPVPQCGSTKADYPDITLVPNSGAQPFQFKIVNDNTGLNITFAKANPIWVGASGPPTGPGVNSQVHQVAGGGKKTLTFVDKNSLPSSTQPAPVTLTYQLNFVDKQGNPVTSIDPDIRNGGKTFFGSYEGQVAAVVTVIALLLLVLWYRARAARNVAKEG